MEADLQRYYRVDLRDLWRGGLTLRRLRVLLDGLPPDSLWWTAMRQRDDLLATAGGGDVDTARWDTTHELLAALIDATNEVAWTVAQVNSKHKLPSPSRFPRPGTKPRRRSMSPTNRARVQQWIKASRNRR